jgi:hypothetical protein
LWSVALSRRGALEGVEVVAEKVEEAEEAEGSVEEEDGRDVVEADWDLETFGGVADVAKEEEK